MNSSHNMITIYRRALQSQREKFYKLWLANKANRLRQGLDDPDDCVMSSSKCHHRITNGSTHVNQTFKTPTLWEQKADSEDAN